MRFVTLILALFLVSCVSRSNKIPRTKPQSSVARALVAPNSYCIILPGQTFVSGACDADGYCVVTDAPTGHTGKSTFGIDVYAIDGACAVDTTANGTVSVNWTGADTPAGDGTVASVPASLAFTNGVASSSVSIVAAITPFFDDGSVYGVSADADETLWNLDFSLPTDTSSSSFFIPGGNTPHSNSYFGDFGFQVTNGTGGGILSIEANDPDGSASAWALSASASQIWDATGATQITTGWTTTVNNQGKVVFTATDSTVFPDGTTLRFQPKNASGLYPNIGLNASVNYSASVYYAGFQTGSQAFTLTVLH